MKAQEMVMEINNTKYWRTVNNYYYKREQGAERWTRIGKAEWEQVFDEYIQNSADEAKAVEPKPKKTTKRSKDVAFEGTGFAGGITLTSKQVDFLKVLPQSEIFDGFEQGIWCDCITDAIGWNPMTVGAMISTLREKHLVSVSVERVNGKKCKSMNFTETGLEVVKQLGLA